MQQFDPTPIPRRHPFAQGTISKAVALAEVPHSTRQAHWPWLSLKGAPMLAMVSVLLSGISFRLVGCSTSMGVPCRVPCRVPCCSLLGGFLVR